MRRRTFDKLMTVAGAALALVLIVAGFLLLWGRNFAYDNVRSQLTEQKIFFPEKSELTAAERTKPRVVAHAGEQVTTGPQAEIYANDLIRLHLSGIAGGKTYSEVSDESRANPSNTQLANQVQTLFRGETLRGLLLEAYGFWKFGQIATWAAVAAFAGAAVLGVLVVLGIRHLRHTPPEDVLA